MLLLTACNSNNSQIKGEPYENLNAQQMSEETPTIQKDPEINTVTISAIGDVLIHRSLYEDAYIGNHQYDFSKMFQYVKPYLESSDLTVANSESIIGGTELGLSGYPRFNSPYEIGDTLKAVGVDVVNMANNHSLDRGEKGILNAINHWDQLGITYVGVASSQEASEQMKTVMKNNILFSFLGYTYGTNNLNPPAGKEYLVNYIDEEKMKSDIKQAKEISDVVVVNLHIGNEYERDFNEEQERIAQVLADAGAHIVFAHHSHVLQPVKWYEGINGNKTFVIHSLGNFISGQDKLYTRIGAILQLDVKKTVVYDITGSAMTGIEVSNPRLLPTYVKFYKWKNFEIYPLYRLTNHDLPNASAIYGEIKAHMSKYEPDLQFIESEPVY